MNFPSNGITKVRLFFELANFSTFFFKNPFFMHGNNIFTYICDNYSDN